MEREYCVINPVTRTISIPVSQQVLGVESDDISERRYFRCPKIIGDGIDLTVAKIYVNAQNANGTDAGKDRYEVEDVQEDGEDITFSWVIPRKIVAYQGKAKFSICVIVGNTEKEWNTTIAEGTVLQGLELTTPEEQERGQDFLMVLTADADCDADSMELGKSAYVQGKKIEGTLGSENELVFVIDKSELSSTVINIPNVGQSKVPMIKHTGTIQLRYSEKPVLLKGGIKKELSCMEAASTTYGDATRGDVRKGRTFTSSSGVKLEGTMGSGKVAQGTITGAGAEAVTIDTGLSGVTTFILYAKTVTGSTSGVLSLYYDESGTRATGLSYSSPLTWPSTSHGEVTVDGGKVTYTPKENTATSNLMTREYDWIAVE